MKCPHAEKCNGCQLWDVDYDQSVQIKVEKVLKQLGNLPFRILKPDTLAVRERVDLSWHQGVGPGLYGKFKEGNAKEIELVTQCQVMSPRLLGFYKEVLEIEWPAFAKASIRLRVGPQGEKGIWLDLANVEIKALLENESLCRELLDRGWIVEVGQRQKVLQFEDRFRLAEPEFHNWSATFFQGKEIPIAQNISSFSQPGRKVNLLLVQSLLDSLEQLSNVQKIVEFGSGSGNLTLPLALSTGKKVLAIENDPALLTALKESLQKHHLSQQVEVKRQDLQRGKISVSDFEYYDTVVVDPPKSGLMNFIEILGQPQFRNLVYISCYPENLIRDVEELKKQGWKSTRVEFVDQFPRTQIIETVLSLQKY